MSLTTIDPVARATTPPEATPAHLLAEPGIVRADLRDDVHPAPGEGGVDGVPLHLRVRVADPGGRPVPAAAVSVWHADPRGTYSGHGPGAGHTWLRGVQPTGRDGVAAFGTIVPGAPGGQWPGLHLAVYRDLYDAVSGADPLGWFDVPVPREVVVLCCADPAYRPSAARLRAALGAVSPRPHPLTTGADAVWTGDPGRGFVARPLLTVDPFPRLAGSRHAPATHGRARRPGAAAAVHAGGRRPSGRARVVLDLAEPGAR